MSRRDQANQRVLQTRSTRSTAAYQDACRLLQNRTRALKSDWWERKPVELQRAADRNNMKGFYNGLKESMVTHEEGTCSPEINRWNGDLLWQHESCARWSEHFQKLLNVPGDIDHEALDNIPQRITKTSLNMRFQPWLRWLEQSPAWEIDDKAPGPDGIPADGGDNLFSRLHHLITNAWEVGSAPQAWNEASTVTIYKEDDRVDCGNYRGSSLLSVASKFFARILLNRLSIYPHHQR